MDSKVSEFDKVKLGATLETNLNYITLRSVSPDKLLAEECLQAYYYAAAIFLDQEYSNISNEFQVFNSKYLKNEKLYKQIAQSYIDRCAKKGTAGTFDFESKYCLVGFPLFETYSGKLKTINSIMAENLSVMMRPQYLFDKTKANLIAVGTNVQILLLLLAFYVPALLCFERMLRLNTNKGDESIN